jgi:hypothetical protein
MQISTRIGVVQTMTTLPAMTVLSFSPASPRGRGRGRFGPVEAVFGDRIGPLRRRLPATAALAGETAADAELLPHGVEHRLLSGIVPLEWFRDVPAAHMMPRKIGPMIAESPYEDNRQMPEMHIR